MSFEYADIPEDLLDECEEMREHLLKSAAEASDELMEKYLSEGLSEEELKRYRARTLANEIVPVLGGSAFKNKGVQAVLDAVIEYLPSPQVKAIEGLLKMMKLPRVNPMIMPFCRLSLQNCHRPIRSFDFFPCLLR